MLVLEAFLLLTLGLVVTLGCLAGRSNDRLLRRHVHQQARVRRLARLQPVDPARQQRALHLALNAGIAFGVLVVAVGVLILV